jgi:hypothetical protein
MKPLYLFCDHFNSIRTECKRAFPTKGLEKKSPSRDEFTAFGQASIEMARGVFQMLRACEATLFAACIPTDIDRPGTVEAAEYLRKDQVFLSERFFYFLQERGERGVLVSTRWIGSRPQVRSEDRAVFQPHTNREVSNVMDCPDAAVRRFRPGLPDSSGRPLHLRDPLGIQVA